MDTLGVMVESAAGDRDGGDGGPAEHGTMAGLFQLPDELWERIERLLPAYQNTHRFGGGRPRVPDRQVMDGIFFVLRTGCQWRRSTGPGSAMARRPIGVFKSGSGRVSSRRCGCRRLAITTPVSGSTGRGCRSTDRWEKPVGRREDGPQPDRPRQARIQAQRDLRDGRHPDRPRDRRRQPQRLQTCTPNHSEHPDQAPRSDPRASPGRLSGQGLRPRLHARPAQRGGLHAAHPKPWRRSPTATRRSRRTRATLGRRTDPLLDQPLPRPPPLVGPVIRRAR